MSNFYVLMAKISKVFRKEIIQSVQIIIDCVAVIKSILFAISCFVVVVMTNVMGFDVVVANLVLVFNFNLDFIINSDVIDCMVSIFSNHGVNVHV